MAACLLCQQVQHRQRWVTNNYFLIKKHSRIASVFIYLRCEISSCSLVINSETAIVPRS